jgi:hypothetical protein
VRGSDGLLRDYRAAFLSYLPRRSEAALHRGYELGRAAIVDNRSVLEIVQVHHQVLADVLRETGTADIPDVTTAASEFLLEVLSTFDMTHRRLHESRPAQDT